MLTPRVIVLQHQGLSGRATPQVGVTAREARSRGVEGGLGCDGAGPAPSETQRRSNAPHSGAVTVRALLVLTSSAPDSNLFKCASSNAAGVPSP